jgi:outer membrane protein assembly factor BamD (BamD/ComL family)
MYMAPDNSQANREKAITYLRRLLVQYPNSELRSKAARHLDQALNR